MREFRTPMLVSLLSIPLLSFLYICQAFLQGKGKIFSALFSEKILKSVFFLFVSGIFFFAAGNHPLGFSTVAVVNVASFFVAFFFIFLSLRRQTAGNSIRDVSAYAITRWKECARTF